MGLWWWGLNVTNVRNLKTCLTQKNQSVVDWNFKQFLMPQRKSRQRLLLLLYEVAAVNISSVWTVSHLCRQTVLIVAHTLYAVLLFNSGIEFVITSEWSHYHLLSRLFLSTRGYTWLCPSEHWLLWKNINEPFTGENA